MKKSSAMQRLEEALRSSKLVGSGFMGTDRRPVEEVIEADAAELRRLGRSAAEVAGRMREITARAIARQGAWTRIGADMQAAATDTRGSVPCPWPHAGRYAKTVVALMNRCTGRVQRWSMLNVHMIEAHGFFEGKGSKFRIEPEALVKVLFTSGSDADQ